jgi:ankyrin repeat protein
VRKLLQRGAKADLKDNGGSTALILATAGGNTESVRILLQHGADVNQRGRDGATPLIVAVDNRVEMAKGYPGAGRPVEFVEVIKLLLAKGANVHAKTAEGKTALSIAKARQLTKTLKLLRQAGAKY